MFVEVLLLASCAAGSRTMWLCIKTVGLLFFFNLLCLSRFQWELRCLSCPGLDCWTGLVPPIQLID
jgi:hypothetical protein